LMLLASGSWLLARLWVGPWEATFIGFAAAANQAVLGWALMLNFTVATCAFSLWAIAAYLRSEGFQRLNWSLVAGLSIGLLLLSRSIAPIYAAALALVILVDLLRRHRASWLNGALALLVAFAVAAPWWLISGPTAIHYLTTAGYQPSSGFARSGARLTPSAILDRVRWTTSDLGAVQSVILLAAPLLLLALRWRRLPGAWIVGGWMFLTLIGLAT